MDAQTHTEAPEVERLATSTALDELAKAFVLAQSEFESVKKDSKGQVGPRQYEYASLGAVLAQVREPLAKHGLAVLQLSRPTDGSTIRIVSMLLHSSGQFISSDLVLRPTKTDPQGLGSAITYARRYAIQALLGLTVDDDDAQSHQRGAQHRAESERWQPNGPAGGYERRPEGPEPAQTLSDAQLRALNAAGNQLYGSAQAWDDKRPEIVGAVTKGRTRSSSELMPREASQIIDGLKKQIQGKEAAAREATANAPTPQKIRDQLDYALSMRAISTETHALDPNSMTPEQRTKLLAELEQAIDDAIPF